MSFQPLFFTHDVSSQPSARCFWIYHFELIRQGQEEIGFKLIFTSGNTKTQIDIRRGYWAWGAGQGNRREEEAETGDEEGVTISEKEW